ncbi:hypothetical protein V502_04994 [Pseudogymnoascus sp. VKM F-4520 (FW-2644)]|nr:hypothetical protein V502_04994 [Pseudogymnoascus sp. VKM F-4520 (FW-2644)]
MQAVIRRTVLAERQAARRLVKRRTKNQHDEMKTRREHERFAQQHLTGSIKNARTARREDYDLGPLAPRRDVGLKKETYGTIHSNQLHGQKLTMEERMEVNPSGGRYANIVAGDRVVLLEGSDKGRIGKVQSFDAEKQQITVEGMNMVDIAVPKWMMTSPESDDRPVRSVEKPLSIAAVKLVVPLPDPSTGTVRDVIVRDIVNSKVFHNKSGGVKYTRMIAGLNTVIPWPKTAPKEHPDHDADTLRIDVETRTFLPTLLKPPMPDSVIDELRNRFSIFRTRHDDAYLEKKEAEEAAKEERKQSIRLMRTPLNEVNKRERTKRKALGKGELTEEMLAGIGAVIARKRGKALEAAGLEAATF